MAQRNRLTLLVLSWVLIAACGPDTIVLRPALDTPAQHVKNGHSLLARGKIDAANNEFIRAKNLNAGYAPAYVGLALVQGHRGDIPSGFKTLNQAKALVVTPDEAQAVDRGYELLQGLQSTAQN